MSKKFKGILISGTVAVSLAVTAVVGHVALTTFFDTNNIFAASSQNITLSDMPSEYKDSIEWVYNNRILVEDSISRRNLIFDQIFAGNGSLNYVIRWQSDEPLTLSVRQQIKEMLNRQINNWNNYLAGYDEWPYDSIDVNITGWAVNDEAIIEDPQPDEIIYTDTITDGLYESNQNIPELLPCAPSTLSRAEHFSDSSYSYDGDYSNRFDMYLWGTSGFEGGAGGDWGQRVSDQYILQCLNDDEAHVIEHEMGHGFGLPDFYEEDDRPPMGFPDSTIMWAGNSQTLTDWDGWMLRYIWSQIKSESGRFNINDTNSSDNDATYEESSSSEDTTDNSNQTNSDFTNIAGLATTSSSYCSPWETMDALNNGYTPTSSEDRGSLVYGNWPYTGTQWVQYTFDEEYTISGTSVYWFYDGAGIDLPSSAELQYQDAKGNWVSLATVDTEKDTFNTANFKPVSAKAVRLSMTSNDTYSTGIIQWQLFGYDGSTIPSEDSSEEDNESSSEVIIPETTESDNNSSSDSNYDESTSTESSSDDTDNSYNNDSSDDEGSYDPSIWTFDTDAFASYKKIKETTEIDGLTLNASSSEYLTVKHLNKNIGDTTYAAALALNGTGDINSRSVSFDVSGPSTITITAASSGAAERTLCICDASGTIINTLHFTASGSSETFNYTVNAGQLTIYSQNNGLNLFEIYVEE